MILLIKAVEKECESDACKLYAKRLESTIDDSIDPCDDFSSYVCGHYNFIHKIPKGKTSIDSFDEAQDEIFHTLKNRLELQELINEDHPQTKAAIYYRSCIDMDQRNQLSKEPFLEILEKFNNQDDYMEKLKKLIQMGITSRLFNFDTGQDDMNPQNNILNLRKPNFVLPEYILQQAEEEKKQIERFKRYMNKVLDILEIWTDDRSMIEKIITLNIDIAKALPSLVNQNDPEKIYNKVNISYLHERCDQIPWITFINGLLEGTCQELKLSDEIIVFDLNYIDNLCKVIKTYKSNKFLNRILMKDLEWAAIESLISHGSEEFISALDSEKTGVVGNTKLWKKCVDDASTVMTDIIGNMYVKGNFDQDIKLDIEDMLFNIRKALKKELDEITWMDHETKTLALLKLNSIHQKIGYSENIMNQKELTENYKEIKLHIDKYLSNYITLRKAKFINSIKDIGEQIPNDKWQTGPQEVNAYYNPLKNEIVIPAALLRFPFYDIHFPVTLKYGGIGTILGHELLHAFDTIGSKYDDKGTLRDWWSQETRMKYNKKIQCIIDQYGNYTIYNQKLTSDLTIGEDIADNSGTRMAFFGSQLSKQEKIILPGLNFTSNKLFFINEAMTWCTVSTKESLLESMKSDQHTIWKYRINGPLSNMPEFSEAFNCNHDKKMNRHGKCLVW